MSGYVIAIGNVWEHCQLQGNKTLRVSWNIRGECAINQSRLESWFCCACRGLDIAYIPDAPKSSPVRAESGKALSSEGTPQDGAAAESVSDQRSRPAAEAPSSASSLPAPPLPVSASAVTGEAATETASLERRSWFRMPFGRTSPSTPWCETSEA